MDDVISIYQGAERTIEKEFYRVVYREVFGSIQVVLSICDRFSFATGAGREVWADANQQFWSVLMIRARENE